MTKKVFMRQVRQLDMSGDVKTRLERLWSQSKQAAEMFVQFLHRHRRFVDSMALGALIVLLSLTIPYVGTIVAIIALLVGAGLGLTREWKAVLHDAEL